MGGLGIGFTTIKGELEVEDVMARRCIKAAASTTVNKFPDPESPCKAPVEV